MVFFTCDGCGETLKKNQVDGHASRCRNCYAVSCVDCSITFYGDDYRNHTTCTYTEKDNLVADRTGGGGNNQKKKKQTPQEAWMELLQSSVDSAPPTIKYHLQQMVQLDNIPRKEKQFRNFAMNSLRLGRGPSATRILDCIWDHLNQQREKLKQAKAEQVAADQQRKSERTKQQQQDQATTTTITKNEEKSSNKNVRVSDDSDHDDNSDNDDKDQKKKNEDKKLYKNVKKATKKLLKKATGKSMKYKSLQKAIREKMGGGDNKKIDKEIIKQIIQNVINKESKKFQLDGKNIRLIV